MQELMCFSGPENDNYVNLAKTSQGRLLRKMILPMGPFVHPADPKTKINVDKNFAETMIRNFHAGVCSIVPVPIVNDENRHVEDPLRNSGQVIDLEYDDSGIYATIDARKHTDDFGKTILGCSAMLHLNQMDTKTGQRVGPTLLHVAATNRPHISNMRGFEEIAQLSADTSNETPVLMVAEQEALELSDTPKDSNMTKEELIAALKEQGVDVPALQEQAATAVELSAQLDELNGQLTLSGSGETVSITDMAAALVELSDSNQAQAAQLATLAEDNKALKLSAATAEIDGLIEEGRVLPKQKEAMVELSMTDRAKFEALLPDTAIVKLSENGVLVHEVADTALSDKVAHYTEIARKANAGFKKN